MKYEQLNFKIPVESPDYAQCSDFATSTIVTIVSEAISQKRNQIILNTNLRHGLPLENINKIGSSGKLVPE